eukprot:7750089-Pyramimonas_sp.AAC.1
MAPCARQRARWERTARPSRPRAAKFLRRHRRGGRHRRAGRDLLGPTKVGAHLQDFAKELKGGAAQR